MCDGSHSLQTSHALSYGWREEEGGSLYFSPDPQTLTQSPCLLSPSSFHSVHLQGGCAPIHRSAPRKVDSSHSRRPTYSPYCVLGIVHSPEPILLWLKPCWQLSTTAGFLTRIRSTVPSSTLSDQIRESQVFLLITKYVSLSQGSHNQLPQVEWLKTTEVYSFVVLEARYLKSSCR